jgi:hypothetical protein
MVVPASSASAGAVELFVEGLAVGQVGQAVGGGVAADLFQVFAQTVDLGGGFRQASLQRLVVLLDAAGGLGQAADDDLQLADVLRGVEFLGRAGQGLAVGGVALLGVLDGLGDRFQLLAQQVAGVADLFVQLGLGQVGRGQLFAEQFGERFAQRDQTGEFTGQGAVGIGDEVGPQLEVQRGRPNLMAFHQAQGAAGDLVGLRAAQRGLDVRHL